MRKNIVSVFALAMVMASQNYAATPVLGWGYSLGYKGMQVVTGGYGGIWDGTNGWSGWFDPPSDIISGKVTFAYDPSLIVIHPEASGFVGPFSNDPSFVLPVIPDGYYPGQFDARTLPGPRPGMVWSLDVEPTTVTLSFDLSANPLTLNTDDHFNFFELAMETKVPIDGWTVETTSTGQFRELGSPSDQSLTFGNCSSGGADYRCGAQTTLGLAAIMPTPEPGSVTLFAIGLVLIILPVARKKIGNFRRTL